MTNAIPAGDGFIAVYWNEQRGRFVHATRADGQPILCETEELAFAVAECRLQRINWRPI